MLRHMDGWPPSTARDSFETHLPCEATSEETEVTRAKAAMRRTVFDAACRWLQSRESESPEYG